MTELNDHQFEILPEDTALDGFVFGIGADVSVGGDGFDTGEHEWLTQDSQNTRRGNLGFGRDVLGARTWSWSSHVNRDTPEGALETLDDFSAAWLPELLAREPGAQTALRYKVGGRVRRVYGRPRRFSAPPTNTILSGTVNIDHDFQCVDAFTYDDIEQQAQILYSTSVVGAGFELPAEFPLATIASEGYGGGQLAIGGRARAYPIIRFNGPWINPVLDTGEWVLKWTGSILDGGWVEVDTRPWALTVKDQGGASVAGGLDRQVWLEDCWFAPGSQPQIALSGIAESGDASVVIKWRNTWTSL